MGAGAGLHLAGPSSGPGREGGWEGRRGLMRGGVGEGRRVVGWEEGGWVGGEWKELRGQEMLTSHSQRMRPDQGGGGAEGLHSGLCQRAPGWPTPVPAARGRGSRACPAASSPRPPAALPLTPRGAGGELGLPGALSWGLSTGGRPDGHTLQAGPALLAPRAAPGTAGPGMASAFPRCVCGPWLCAGPRTRAFLVSLHRDGAID